MKQMLLSIFPVIKHQLFLIAVTVAVGCHGQESNKGTMSLELVLNPKNIPLNKPDLYYNPFGEYGTRYLNSEDLGLNFKYYLTNRLALGGGLSYQRFHFETHGFDPFVDFNDGDAMHFYEGSETTQAGSVNLDAKFGLFKSKRLNLSILASPYLIKPFNQHERTEFTYVNNSISVEEVNTKIEQLIYFGVKGGLLLDVVLTEKFSLFIGSQVTYGTIAIANIEYTPVIAPRLELNFPVGIGYRW